MSRFVSNCQKPPAKHLFIFFKAKFVASSSVQQNMYCNDLGDISPKGLPHRLNRLNSCQQQFWNCWFASLLILIDKEIITPWCILSVHAYVCIWVLYSYLSLFYKRIPIHASLSLFQLGFLKTHFFMYKMLLWQTNKYFLFSYRYFSMPHFMPMNLLTYEF